MRLSRLLRVFLIQNPAGIRFRLIDWATRRVSLNRASTQCDADDYYHHRLNPFFHVHTFSPIIPLTNLPTIFLPYLSFPSLSYGIPNHAPVSPPAQQLLPIHLKVLLHRSLNFSEVSRSGLLYSKGTQILPSYSPRTRICPMV